MLYGLFTILPFTVCLFWMTVLLLDWRRDNAAQHVLAAFMGASAVLYLCHAAFFNHESSMAATSECIYAFCNIAVFPLYYLYVCRLTEASEGLPLRRLWVLLPAVAICLWAVILNAFAPGDAEAQGLRILVMRIVFMVQLVPVCWVCFRKLRHFDNEIANYYSDPESRSVRPTICMMALLIGAALISGAVNFLGRDYFDTSELLLSIPSVLFTTLLFGVGYVGNRQEFCINDLIRDEEHDSYAVAPEKLSSDRLTDGELRVDDDDEALSHLITRLDSLMAERQLYLQHDLRLSEVAEMLGVGRTTLSQRINQELHLSFSNYINNLRVEHACRLLSDPDSARLSLTGVAEMSGFSSDSSFYRAFRRHTGKTPKQFMESKYPKS